LTLFFSYFLTIPFHSIPFHSTTTGISMAGRRVDGNNAHEVYGELKQRCKHPGPDITKQWPGAAPNLSKRMCKNINKCRDIWVKMFEDDLKPQIKTSL